MAHTISDTMGTPLAQTALMSLGTGLTGGAYTYWGTGRLPKDVDTSNMTDEEIEQLRMSKKDRIRRALIGTGLWSLVGVGAGGGLAKLRQSQAYGADGTPDIGYFKSLTMTDDEFMNASNNVKRNHNMALKPKKASLKKNAGFIETDVFNQTLFKDVNTGVLQPANAFAIAGALNATSSRNNSSFVTPGQITNTLMNAGIGYATGAVVGKALGAMFGLSQETQNTLRNTGMWGGVLNTIGNNINR